MSASKNAVTTYFVKSFQLWGSKKDWEFDACGCSGATFLWCFAV